MWVIGIGISDLLPIPCIYHCISVAVTIGAHLKTADLPVCPTVVRSFAMETPEKVRPLLLTEDFVPVINLIHNFNLLSCWSGRLAKHQPPVFCRGSKPPLTRKII